MEWRGDNSQPPTPTPKERRSKHRGERRGNKLVRTLQPPCSKGFPWELVVGSWRLVCRRRSDRIEGTLGRNRISFLGRETFLRDKRAAGRPKDLADIDALEPGDG